MVHTKPGYYQGEPIAIGIPDLPPLDGVLISHAHYDHCDLKNFAAHRDRNVPLVVASTSWTRHARTASATLRR